RTSRFLEQIMTTIIDLDPDFLCITGDLIDQSGITIDELAALRKFDRPIYYCIGNHERYEDFEEIINRLEKLGINVLRNRSMDFGQLQIIGIDDADDKHQVQKILPSIEVDRNRYSILLYHRPQGLEAAHANGINLKLSGHTHKGQIVPFNLLVNRVFEYTQGYYEYFDTVLYVNEGTGTWGPTMRVGTRSEITLFELSPV
ncbi:MAG: putative MPP superfamily phosphohydrolase, partial [Gammaproteobacteria bacterium]